MSISHFSFFPLEMAENSMNDDDITVEHSVIEQQPQVDDQQHENSKQIQTNLAASV